MKQENIKEPAKMAEKSAKIAEKWIKVTNCSKIFTNFLERGFER